MKTKKLLSLLFIIASILCLSRPIHAAEIALQDQPQTDSSIISKENGYDNSGVYNFVSRLYTVVLNRQPDETGLQEWYEQLVSQRGTGAQVVFGFLFSDEFAQKNYSDEAYLEILYQTLFDRGPDTLGYEQWLAQLKAGVSRKTICKGFIDSPEFKTLCNNFGIISGTIESQEDGRKVLLTDQFVERLYETALLRSSDSEGKSQWKVLLLNGTSTGAEIVQGFIFSQECLDQNLSDSDYIDLLYRALFDRTADNEGKANWIDLLKKGMTRQYVCCGFINSQEFQKLCAEYGIIPGNASSSLLRDKNQALTLWVYDLYISALGRPCSIQEQENALELLLSKKLTGNDFVRSVFLSDEYQARQTSSEEFLALIYDLVLKKDKAGSDFSQQLQRLFTGSGRDTILQECFRMPEFAERCRNLGIIWSGAPIEIPETSSLQVFNSGSFVSPYSLNSIQKAVNNFSSQGYNVGFVLVDLNTGQGICYNSNQNFYCASTIKGPYVVCLNETIPSASATWGITMRQTIAISSNEGYAALRSSFGSAQFRQWLDEAGCTAVDAYRNYPGLTPKELTQMWIKCYDYFTSGKENSQWCAQLFTNTLQSSILNTFRGKYTTYSKAGWIASGSYMTVQNDAGIVMKPGHPYAVTIMSSAYGRLDLLSDLVIALDNAHSEMTR